MSTSGVIEDASLVIRSRYGLRLGTATVNQFDDESLTRTVRLTEELARLAPADPELQPLLEPQQYSRSPGAWVDATAAVSPEFRAEAAAHSIEKAKASGCVAAGYLTDSANLEGAAQQPGHVRLLRRYRGHLQRHRSDRER